MVHQLGYQRAKVSMDTRKMLITLEQWVQNRFRVPVHVKMPII